MRPCYAKALMINPSFDDALKQKNRLISIYHKREGQRANEIMVFISYVREDGHAANRLYTDLNNTDLNLKPWIDTQIRAGQRWEDEIKKAMQASRLFIPLISSNSIEKKGDPKKLFEYTLKVFFEKVAQRQKISVIPVRLDDCKITYGLEKIRHIDLFPDWKEGMEKLLRAIKPAEYYS